MELFSNIRPVVVVVRYNECKSSTDLMGQHDCKSCNEWEFCTDSIGQCSCKSSTVLMVQRVCKSYNKLEFCTDPMFQNNYTFIYSQLIFAYK